MHLIDTGTLQLETFTSENDVAYIILSHRWEEEEVLYEDMQDLASCTKSGVNKLEAFCKLARDMNHRYAWMDTCCIDKKSSADLAEAINSMYQYYRRADDCIAYLSDVADRVDSPGFEPSFQKSVWFTRCWTLQELLAPRYMTFYNSSWERLDTKEGLLASISDITTIDKSALEGLSLANFSIAQRMSWASYRQATRIEDIAYSLMGLFDVNMPMLYGEGRRAFTRLQEEILRYSDDETIFAWANSGAGSVYTRGLLASSPADFKDCRWMRSTRLHNREEPFVLTNRGLAGNLNMARERRSDGSRDIYTAFLNVSLNLPGQEQQFVGIFLRPVTSYGTDQALVSDARSFERHIYYGRKSDEHRWYGSHIQIASMKSSMYRVRVRHRGQIVQREPDPAYGFNLEKVIKYTGVPSSLLPSTGTQTGGRRISLLSGAQGAKSDIDENLVVRLPPDLEGPMCEMILLFNEFSDEPVFVQLGLSKENLPTFVVIDCHAADGSRLPFDPDTMDVKTKPFWDSISDTDWTRSGYTGRIDDIPHTIVYESHLPGVYAFKVEKMELTNCLCVQADSRPSCKDLIRARWAIKLTPYERQYQKLWTLEIKRSLRVLSHLSPSDNKLSARPSWHVLAATGSRVEKRKVISSLASHSDNPTP